jgi:hypothetical protein
VTGDQDRPTFRGVPLTEADQQHFAEILARHHAADTLTLEELEQRLEALYAATTREQAAQLVADLPPLPPGAGLIGAGARRGSHAPRRERPWWRRGHGEPAKAGPGWVPTNERFRDPSTNRMMRVWVDPADGARHYLPEDTA